MWGEMVDPGLAGYPPQGRSTWPDAGSGHGGSAQGSMSYSPYLGQGSVVGLQADRAKRGNSDQVRNPHSMGFRVPPVIATAADSGFDFVQTPRQDRYRFRTPLLQLFLRPMGKDGPFRVLSKASSASLAETLDPNLRMDREIPDFGVRSVSP
ncbi:hypothetical protein R1flu_020522 [Riccia fluitans]|uniref:Uncharacterized protein n=1 Tax=Riccia fluitans TaxID=41844 RepID=A0ABD1ZLR3_9MARC